MQEDLPRFLIMKVCRHLLIILSHSKGQKESLREDYFATSYLKDDVFLWLCHQYLNLVHYLPINLMFAKSVLRIQPSPQPFRSQEKNSKLTLLNTITNRLKIHKEQQSTLDAETLGEKKSFPSPFRSSSSVIRQLTKYTTFYLLK